MTEARYGVDAVTFYHPSFWGVDTYDDILEVQRKDPRRIWETIFDALNQAEVSALELTFPPADWQSAVSAYGSAGAFKDALDARGLTLTGGFILGTEWGLSQDAANAVQEALAYTEFLGEVGGDVMVAGLPMRRTRAAEPPLFIDQPFAQRVVDVVHAVADATLRRGVKLALHTEAHSMLCTRRDVNLLMNLTDPEYVFFCPDTAHLVLAGGDPVEIVTPHRDRVVIAHWKDARGRMPGGEVVDEHIHETHREYMCRLGTGVVDWRRWSELYGRTAGSSVRLLELDASPDPIGDMKHALTYLETANR